MAKPTPLDLARAACFAAFDARDAAHAALIIAARAFAANPSASTAVFNTTLAAYDDAAATLDTARAAFLAADSDETKAAA